MSIVSFQSSLDKAASVSSSSSFSLLPSKSRAAIVAERDLSRGDDSAIGFLEREWMDAYPSVVDKLRDAQDVDISLLFEEHQRQEQTRNNANGAARLWRNALLASGSILAAMLLSFVLSPWQETHAVHWSSIVAALLPSLWLTDKSNPLCSFLAAFYSFSHLFMSSSSRNYIRYSLWPWASNVLQKRLRMAAWKSVWSILGTATTMLLKDALLTSTATSAPTSTSTAVATVPDNSVIVAAQNSAVGRYVMDWLLTAEAFVEKSFRKETISWAKKGFEKVVEHGIGVALTAFYGQLQEIFTMLALRSPPLLKEEQAQWEAIGDGKA